MHGLQLMSTSMTFFLSSSILEYTAIQELEDEVRLHEVLARLYLFGCMLCLVHVSLVCVNS